MLKKASNLFFLSLFFFIYIAGLYVFCDESSKNKACVIPIKGMVDKGLSGFVVRAIKEAEENGCRTAIFEIDTFGGRVDAAIEIRDAIMDAPFEKTVAYINKRAISAGALIALSSQAIYMAEGSTIGAAMPVQIGGTGEAGPVGEKYVSYLRKEFKSTAEKNGYPSNIAEAFVDSDVEIEGLIEKEKLLTLTSQEAKKYNLTADIVQTREKLLEKLGFTENDISHYKMNWSEVLVRIFTHPVISSLLLTFGFLGMIFELRMPGFGVSGMISLVCLMLFFLGHYLIGMAEWFDVLLFLMGVVFILLEILVFPGFGLSGILGMLCLFLGILFALTKKEIPFVPVPFYQYTDALMIIGTSFLMSIGGAFIFFRYLPRVLILNKIILERASQSYTGEQKPEDIREFEKGMIGKEGISYTSLRPSGKVKIDDKLYDVVTYDEFIEKGKRVVVTEAAPMRIVVEEKQKGEEA